MNDEVSKKRLTKADRDWLDALNAKYRPAHNSEAHRQSMLRDLRTRLKADYVMWAVIEGDLKHRVAVTLEYFDDADGDTDEQVKSWNRWTRIASELNITDETNRIFALATEKQQFHITLTFTDLKKLRVATKWTSLRLVLDSLFTGTQLLRWWNAGFIDSMFTLYRLKSKGDFSYGSGIGYHRQSGRPPFNEYDVLLAQSVSDENEWLHGVSVRPNCGALKLSRSFRLLFPFLARDFNVPQIAEILARTPGRVQKQIATIADVMGVSGESPKILRQAICEHCKLRIHPQRRMEDIASALRTGFAELLKAPEQTRSSNTDDASGGNSPGLRWPPPLDY